jgi:uncharacterized membrane protein YdjX (TVP38/TMEM64 family)
MRGIQDGELKPAEGGAKRDWLGALLRSRVLPILGILLVAGITVAIFLYHDRLSALGAIGYPGVFLVAMVWNSTVLVPIPSFWTYFFLGQIFHPVLVGLAGGTGASVGELTSYLAGFSGRVILKEKRVKIYDRVEKWIKKWGFIVVVGFNLVPFFPFDLVGIACGASRFKIWKFYLACALGRSIAYGFIAFLGSQGLIPNIPFLNPPK